MISSSFEKQSWQLSVEDLSRSVGAISQSIDHIARRAHDKPRTKRLHALSEAKVTSVVNNQQSLGIRFNGDTAPIIARPICSLIQNIISNAQRYTLNEDLPDRYIRATGTEQQVQDVIRYFEEKQSDFEHLQSKTNLERMIALSLQFEQARTSKVELNYKFENGIVQPYIGKVHVKDKNGFENFGNITTRLTNAWKTSDFLNIASGYIIEPNSQRGAFMLEQKLQNIINDHKPKFKFWRFEFG